jgi:ubiquinone/menaquinone biosynthesis C-methylase UbiE
MITLRRIIQIIFGLKKLNIKRNELVLEIGSGNNPHFRSNVLFDKYIDDNTERGETNIIIDRPFVSGDACKLPFKNNSFDYIICKHLIEHLDNPEKLLKELSRVGKRGYIEAPNETWEIIFGRKFHKWLITLNKNKLIFKPKNSENKKLQQFFQNKHDKNYYFRKFYDKNINKFHIIHEWENKINYKIYGKINKQKFKESNIKNFGEKTKLVNLPLKQKITYLVNHILYCIYGKRKVNLQNLLACPNCKSDLKTMHNKLRCTKCSKEFNIKNKIPIMI